MKKISSLPIKKTGLGGKRLAAVFESHHCCALLVKDADKITLGQKLTVIAPHTLESVIRQPPDLWLSNAQITHYQSVLLDKDLVEFGQPSHLNPATLLPETSDTPVLHTCQNILAKETGICQDIWDHPLIYPEVTCFTDGRSFVLNGKEGAGVAVVSDMQ